MKLEWYILRQLVVAFVFAVAGILFVALPGIAVTAVHKMPLADATVILRYVPIVLETLAPYVLPICFLLSVVATFGRLAADREWTAIQMAGVQPLKMLRPALMMAVALAVSTFWMVSNELPRAKARQRAALLDAATSSLKNLQPGRTTLRFHDFYLNARWRDPDDQAVLYEVHIRKPDEEGESLVDIFAKRAHIRVEGDWLKVDLDNAQAVSAEAGGRSEVEKAFVHVHTSKLVGEEDQKSDRPKYLTDADIKSELRAGGLEQERERVLKLELHQRKSMSIAFFVFLGLGAPTGLIMRRGTQLGALAIAVVFGLVYYLCAMRVGKVLGEVGAVPTWAAAWATPVLGFVFGLVLLRKGLRR